jgi:hypothetical protein
MPSQYPAMGKTTRGSFGRERRGGATLSFRRRRGLKANSSGMGAGMLQQRAPPTKAHFSILLFFAHLKAARDPRKARVQSARRSTMARGHFIAGSLFGLIAALASCSSGDESSSSSDGGSQGSGASGGLSLGGSQGKAGSFGAGGASAGLLEGVDGSGPSSSGSVVPVLPGAECAGQVFEGESLPLELLIMMDRSISMGDSEPESLLPGGGTKWDAVRVGFQDFFALPQVQSLSAGIDFFSQGSCDPVDYSTPEVGIAPITSSAAEIMDAYDQHQPGDNTPIGPALEGALMHAYDWKQGRGAQVAVVLVTDGVPNGCGTTTMDPRGGADGIAPIAAQYASGAPPIPTYVLGIQGIEVSATDFAYVVTTIAQAGGTEAVIVEATDDLAAEFAAGLEGIRESAAPPCSYSIPLPPTGEQLDLSLVNVVLVPQTSGAEPILNVAGPDDCQYGGWYYDPPGSPESIELCPNTCDVVSTLNGAGFQVLFGCATVVPVK